MFEYFLQFIFIHNVKLLLFKHQYVVVFLLHTTETGNTKNTFMYLGYYL